MAALGIGVLGCGIGQRPSCYQYHHSPPVSAAVGWLHGLWALAKDSVLLVVSATAAGQQSFPGPAATLPDASPSPVCFLAIVSGLAGPPASTLKPEGKRMVPVPRGEGTRMQGTRQFPERKVQTSGELFHSLLRRCQTSGEPSPLVFVRQPCLHSCHKWICRAQGVKH